MKYTHSSLKPIDIAGQTIDPATDDLYQRPIIHRNAIKGQLDAASETEKPVLKSEEQAIKILANATSYGIFLELNVGGYAKTEWMVGHGGRPHASRFQERFGWTFAPRDKVIQVENDYEKDVYNGDLGYVADVDPELSELRADFEGRSVAYAFGELDALVPAYAATIHKSQGPEYPR